MYYATRMVHVQETGREMVPGHTQLDIDCSYAPLVQIVMDGDMGAAIVLIDLLSRGRKFGLPVAEDAAWCLRMLNALGIYGADLHVLWGDVCCRSTERMLTLLRACDEERCGVSRDSITYAISCCKQDAPTRELQLVSVVSGL